ncbi:MAG: hypothetical protein HF314_15440 [Ignavibacteria bacterium]|jgi:hypothetical protein|nr:hypothetical protein [Ignavibacteria bacterium]MCU7504474.1 hypothetical protein [Ignavibacteria bacterium]MCU7517947.1 hypothetical protein [Ignavibacteria bacterium]
MKKFTIFLFILISQFVFAQRADDVKFVLQFPIGGELGLNNSPGGYLNLLAGVGVDYVPRYYSIHASYIPFAAEYRVIDINAGYLFNDNASIEDKGVMVDHQDMGDKIQMTFRSSAMSVRRFDRIRFGFTRMFSANKEKNGDHNMNVFYAGYEIDNLVNSSVCALNNIYLDLMYGNYQGQISDKHEMNKFGARLGMSQDWGWFCSTQIEGGYKPISGVTFLFACQLFFML